MKVRHTMSYRFLALIIAGLALLAGSSGAAHPPDRAFTPHDTTETAAPNIEKTAGLIGPVDYPLGVNPLTGLPVDDPALLERSPVIAKISNAPPLVRPQAGIGAADLVYEHYAEGGLTRFSALFYSQGPQRVGSIRSARLIDYELMPMYDGLLAYSGGSIGVEDYLNHSEFADRLFKGVLFGRPLYWRDEAIEVPHNMFTNVAALWDRAAAQGISRTKTLQGMTFMLDAPAAADGPASVIDLRYRAARVRWEYDAAGGLYQRFADGRGHYDANTGQQVTAANVVVLYAHHRLTDIIESQWQGSISYSIEIELWFEGDALLFRDGQQYTARWHRPTREALLSLATPDGEPLPLKPGITWFQVVPLPEQQNPLEEWLAIDPD
jgi:hypothetical protein